MAGASAQQDDIKVTFEAYVRKGGRWLVVDIVHERETALMLGQELAAHKDHEAVRIVRDSIDLRTGKAAERIIFDSEIKFESEIKIDRRPATPPRLRTQEVRPPPPAPEVHRPAAEPEKSGVPWLALVSTVLGLSFAALGFWFIDAIH